MADRQVHLSQAEHNKELAKKLINDPPYHDWGITASFYSAIHYFECWLYDKDEKHTETSIPVGRDGKFKMSPHAWRENLIGRFLSEEAFKKFRKLRDASETARYLTLCRIGSEKDSQWLDGLASEYFPPEEAKKLVERDLEAFLSELGLIKK